MSFEASWQTGDGRRETGDGRRETGDGRRETGDVRSTECHRHARVDMEHASEAALHAQTYAPYRVTEAVNGGAESWRTKDRAQARVFIAKPLRGEGVSCVRKVGRAHCTVKWTLGAGRKMHIDTVVGLKAM